MAEGQRSIASPMMTVVNGSKPQAKGDTNRVVNVALTVSKRAGDEDTRVAARPSPVTVYYTVSVRHLDQAQTSWCNARNRVHTVSERSWTLAEILFGHSIPGNIHFIAWRNLYRRSSTLSEFIRGITLLPVEQAFLVRHA